jgi:hypothetical protein
VTDDLVAPAIEAAGGQNLWNTPRAPTVEMSVGPDGRMTFDAATDTVAVRILDRAAVGTLAPGAGAFKGHLRPTPCDAQHLGYFLGCAN